MSISVVQVLFFPDMKAIPGNNIKVPARVITCPDNPGICKAGECCVYRRGAGKCGPLQERGAMCNPGDNIVLNGVYRRSCPCREGLMCGAMVFECVDEE